MVATQTFLKRLTPWITFSFVQVVNRYNIIGHFLSILSNFPTEHTTHYFWRK
jgi:hypothetical protein